MRLLMQVHAARFAHGRPLPKDIVVRDGALTLIDLEEDPMRVMSLAEAQARDIWLFMTGVVRWLPDRAAAASVFARTHNHMALEAQKALRHMVALARPVSWVLAKTIVHRLGRDLRWAVMANEVMARALRSPR
jgi:tRNA A-37 threonylcarbamoyl transferase component Bud32